VDEEPLMFAHAVEALFHRAFAGQLSARCRERLRQLGVDLDRPLLPAYPLATWLAALEVAAAELLPHLTREAAYYELGHRIVDGYVHTMLGRSVTTVGRLLGPRRVLEGMTHTLRTANNFQLTRLQLRQPGEAQLWVNTRVRVATYYQGLLHATLERAGADGLEVEPGVFTGDGYRYTIRWQTG
jgi:uncharacterized protein (TIGR02265 family)